MASMNAAIAKLHQLNVVTHNVADFTHSAVTLLNPFGMVDLSS